MTRTNIFSIKFSLYLLSIFISFYFFFLSYIEFMKVSLDDAIILSEKNINYFDKESFDKYYQVIEIEKLNDPLFNPEKSEKYFEDISVGSLFEIFKDDPIEENKVTYADTKKDLPITFKSKEELIAELDDEIFTDIQVSKGDNFAKVLKKAGIKNSDIDKIIINGKDTYNFSKIYLGDVVKIFSHYDENLLEKFKLIYRFSNTEELIVSLNEEQNFEYEVNEIPLESEKVYVKGTIKTSLYEAMKDAGLSELAITEVIRIYSFDVDFQRDIYENDSFELLFTKKINEEGKTVEIEDPEYLQLTSRGTPLKYYLFTTPEFSEYFDEKGKGMTKSLMKTPINGARLSSGFGYRKHPILGYNKLHKGVDFAAPSGTPIFAAGNGVVEFAGKNGAYGNYVRIRHDGTFKTAYAHMKGFKKGIYDGARVKQGDIIGYVGTTGRSTGPHLHYEIIQNGEQMNPAKLKLPSGRKLNEKELNQFNNLMLAMNQELDELSKKYAFNEN